jgi:DNA-directed RNA polymerase specialized sigma24 family protein
VNNDPSPDADRDELHLAALRASRAARDVAAEREVAGHLLGPYWEWARSIAYARLTGVPDRAGDAEVIAQQLMLLLFQLLGRKTEFKSPFHVVARVNLRYLIIRYWQKRAGNKSDATDPLDFPAFEGVEDDIQSLDKQVIEFAPWLNGLSERDRRLLCERIFFDISPESVGERLGITANAVNVGLFRALDRARQNQPSPDVSDPAQGAA